MPRVVNVVVQSLSGETIVESHFYPKSTIADVKRAIKTTWGISQRMQALMCGSLTPDDGAELTPLSQPPNWHVIAELVPGGLHPGEVLSHVVVHIPPCAHCGKRTPTAKYCSQVASVLCIATRHVSA